MGTSMSSTDFQQQHLSSFLSYPFVWPRAEPSFRPDPRAPHGRRAQGRSRVAVAKSCTQASHFPGHPLTGPSTAARLGRVGFSPRSWLCFDELHLQRLIMPKTRGGARFWWHRCHTLICGGIQQLIPTMMQYTHRQRGSEAAVPILVSGMKAIGCGEQPLPRVVF